MDDSKNLTSIQISIDQHIGYEHIYMLNGLSFPEEFTLYKYMPYKRLVNSIEKQELVFVSPDTWIDPFEQRFWQTDYSKRYNFTRPDIACMCLTTKSSTNEEASWKMYANSEDKTLRLSFRKKQLFEVLNEFAKNNDCKIVIGKAIYSFDRTNIMTLHTYTNEFFPKDEFKLEHYLTLMCLKRKAFAFENEIRIFIVKNRLNFENGLIKIKTPLDKNIIPRIVIGPLSPFTREDPRQVLYNITQKLEAEAYKVKITSLIKDCNVLQSQLYTKKKPLKEIRSSYNNKYK